MFAQLEQVNEAAAEPVASATFGAPIKPEVLVPSAEQVVDELVRPPRKRAKTSSSEVTLPTQSPVHLPPRRAAAAQSAAATRAAAEEDSGDGDSTGPIVATAAQVRNRGLVSALLQRMNEAARGGSAPRKHKRKRGEVQKAKHNVAEKRRRSEMNDAIDRIKVLLPTKEDEEIAAGVGAAPTASAQKPTKVSVLMDAADYIESVQALCCQLAEENQALHEESHRMKSELAALRVSESWSSAGNSPRERASASDGTASSTLEPQSLTTDDDSIDSYPSLSPPGPYEISPTEVAALGVKRDANESLSIGSSYGRNFATMALLSVLFFTFWGNFLALFDLNDAEYGISRVLLSIPSQPTFTTAFVHFFTEMCRALWGFFCWFRFVFVVYLLSAMRVKHVIPGSAKFEAAKAHLAQVQQMRSKLGTARTFKAARKLAKSLSREVPKEGEFSLYLGLFVQVFRFIGISLWFGYWIERLVIRLRGLRAQVAKAASVELNALHLLVDSFPATNLQFWFAALRLYNDATVFTADTGIVSQELLRVRVYKGISLRLRHHLSAPARWFGIFCDLKGSTLVDRFMSKAAAGARGSGWQSKRPDPSSVSAESSSVDEENSPRSAESDEDDSGSGAEAAVSSSAAASSTVTPSPPVDQIMGIALSAINQLIADIDEGNFNNAEEHAMHLVKFFTNSKLENTNSVKLDGLSRSLAWGKGRINLMVSFTQFCQGRYADAIKTLSSNIRSSYLSDLPGASSSEDDDEDSELIATSMTLLAIGFMQTGEILAASRLLDHVKQRYSLDVSSNAQIRIAFDAAFAKLHMMNRNHTSCLQHLRAVMLLCNASCPDHRFQDLAVCAFTTSIALDLLEASPKEASPRTEALQIVQISLSLLGRASATSRFFLPSYNICMARFAGLQNKRDLCAQYLVKAHESASALNWDAALAAVRAESGKLRSAAVQQVDTTLGVVV